LGEKDVAETHPVETDAATTSTDVNQQRRNRTNQRAWCFAMPSPTRAAGFSLRERSMR